MKKIVFILIALVIGSASYSCKNDTKKTEVKPELTQAEIEAIEQERIKKEEEKQVRLQQVNSVLSKLMLTPETKTFASSVITVALSDMLLKEEGPYTVFAPSEEAFGSMDEESKTILTDGSERSFLERTLRSHIVEGQIDSIALTKNIRNGNGSYQITTLSGDILVATKKGMDIVLKDKNGAKAVIVKSDILGNNGVVHVLDKVLSLEK